MAQNLHQGLGDDSPNLSSSPSQTYHGRFESGKISIGDGNAATVNSVTRIRVSEDGKTIHDHPLRDWRTTVTADASAQLQPGKALTLAPQILFSFNHALGGTGPQKELAFPRPGTYYVQVVTGYGPGQFALAFPVIVEAPQGKDAEAWKLYDDPRVWRLLQDNFFPHRGKALSLAPVDLRERVADIRTRWPDSVYAKVLATLEPPVTKEKVDPFVEAKKQFAAEGYDLDRAAREQPVLWEKEVILPIRELKKQWWDRRLSDDEYAQKCIGCVREFLKKHARRIDRATQPASPDAKQP